MWRAHAVWIALGAGILAQCAPLLATRELPLHDAPGILGLAGVLAHLDDPATRVAEFYDVDLGLYPSVLYFGWGHLAARIGVPVDLAFHAFIALFCLAGPPLALAFVLRAFDRPPALALLALPVAWHQQLWFGFLGSAAGVTGLLAALGFARRVVDRRRPADHLGLAVAVLFVALAHPFQLALTLAVIAPLPFCPVPDEPRPAARLRARALRLACLAPTALFLAGWATRFVGAGASEGVSIRARLARELRIERPPLGEDLRVFVEWLGGGYAGRADDVVAGIAIACLAAFLLLGVRDTAAPAPARGRLWLAWAAAALALGYLLLPNKVHWPTYWWGLRVRCALPLFLVAVVAVRRSPRGLPVAAAAPALAVAVGWAAFVTVDFATHFRGRVLAGFDQALAAIPPGRTVLAMPALEERHYRHAQPYLVQYYVVRKGGRAVPYLGGHRGSYWVTLRPPAPQAPPWGDPRQFVWSEHALGFDYFLVQTPLSGPAPEPFRDAPPGAVTLVSDAGQWRLYRREPR